MDLNASGTPQLSGFLTQDQAVRRAVARRRLRIATWLAVGVWSLAAVALVRPLGLDGSLGGAALWLGGIALIVGLARQRSRSMRDSLASSMVVNERGHIVGRADQVAGDVLKERAIPALVGFGVYHTLGLMIRVTLGENAPGWLLLPALAAGVGTWLLIRHQHRTAQPA